MNRRALARPSRDVEVRTSTRVSGRGGFRDDRVVSPSTRAAPCPRRLCLMPASSSLADHRDSPQGATLKRRHPAGRCRRGGDRARRPVRSRTGRFAWASTPRAISTQPSTVSVTRPRSTCPPGADALIPGCWCEGWGVADPHVGALGVGVRRRTAASRRTSSSGPSTSRPDTADSTVEIGGRLRVRHVFRPSPRPELYQVDLTVENLGATSADVVYRRAIDWDVPPTRVRGVRDDPRRPPAAARRRPTTASRTSTRSSPLSNLGGSGRSRTSGRVIAAASSTSRSECSRRASGRR